MRLIFFLGNNWNIGSDLLYLAHGENMVLLVCQLLASLKQLLLPIHVRRELLALFVREPHVSRWLRLDKGFSPLLTLRIDIVS